MNSRRNMSRRGSTSSNRNRGTTLIEVLFSLALLALVVAPMMSVFTSSAHTSSLAELSERMDAAAAARIEELYGGSYVVALEAHGRDDGGLLTYAKLSPVGLQKDATGRTACFHIIAGTDGQVRVVTPDGQHIEGVAGAGARIALKGDGYTVRVPPGEISGAMPPSLPPLATVFAQDGAQLELTLTGFPVDACMLYTDTTAGVTVKGATPLLLPGRKEALVYVTATAHHPAQQLSDAVIEAVIPLKLWEDTP